MDNKRRIFLRATLSASAVAVAAAAGLLTPRLVLAAWPKQAFEAKDMDGAVQAISGMSGATPSDKVSVKTPDIAENGAVVSVTVKHSIPNAESVSVLVNENTTKLAASYLLSKQSASFITCRVKMRKSSDVTAVVKADGKLYSAKGHVKVTLGGCGG
jgi:sulfur-oxidizing protein SoxY